MNMTPTGAGLATGHDTYATRSHARRAPEEREPGLIEVMSATINIMQDHITRSRMGGDPPDLVITPRFEDYQLMDFHRAAEAIDLGRA